MQKIIPHLWYDKEAVQAAQFYVSIFPDSKITHTSTLNDTPSGSVEMVSFELMNYEFQAISAGPYFTFNPSVSFMIECKSIVEVDALWEKLSPGGTALMELGAYPFSKRFGWIQDQYGLSWQIIYSSAPGARRKITPMIMFVGDVAGKAEQAVRLWTSIFPDGKVGDLMRYAKGEEPDQEGTLKYGNFSLFGQEFVAMDSAHEHQFSFNEAISFIVNCKTQEEIDDYWYKLSAVPEAEQCGWLKDKFGVSWQIVPVGMEQMLQGNDQEKIDRVTQAFLQMKKIDLAALQAVYEG
jgi:predicted 3-demethylubiquinone-9 3-methyltransferase (glyoxalase superfamily)